MPILIAGTAKRIPAIYPKTRKAAFHDGTNLPVESGMNRIGYKIILLHSYCKIARNKR